MNLERYDLECFDYTNYPHLSVWSQAVGDKEYREALVETFANPRAGPTTMYVHIPYCVELCYFCICHKEITRNYERVKRHVHDSLLPELDLLYAHMRHFEALPHVTEMYFGGGSPTILEYAEFDALMNSLRRFVDVEKLDRFNVEVDPRNVDEAKLRFYKNSGATVISMGVQDFDPQVQQAVNRVQSFELTRDTLGMARQLGFTSINFDMLAGLPYQTESSMARTIEQVVELAPDRISFDYFRYNEKYYPHLRLLKKMDAFPTFAQRRQMIARAAKEFAAAGYVRSGFEHWAKPDDRVAKALRDGTATYSVLGVVTGQVNTLAVGRQVHSVLGDRWLFQNHYEQELYGAAIDAGSLPVYRGHFMSADDAIRRQIIFKLRTYFSVNLASFGVDFDEYFQSEKKILEHFIRDGLVEIKWPTLVMTETGVLFAELIASVFDKYTNGRLLAKLEGYPCDKP